MDKEREWVKAINAQGQYFHGKDDSPASAATDLQFSLCADCPADDPKLWWENLEIKAKNPQDAETQSQLRDVFRRKMLRRLEMPPDSASPLGQFRNDFLIQFYKIAEALEKYDSGFFREIADGLDELNEKKDFYSLDLMSSIHDVYLAWIGATIYRWTLLPYKTYVEKGIAPTKQQMRKLTIRSWAMKSLYHKRKIGLLQTHAHEKQSSEVEELIKEESEKLPTQKWQRKWQLAGLTHLKEGRSGRPKTVDKKCPNPGID